MCKEEIIKENKTKKERNRDIAEIDNKIVKLIKAQQKKKLEKEFDTMKNTIAKRGKVSAIFELKKKILGNKMKNVEPSAVLCPETKEIVTEKDKIKKITVDYCVNLLTTNPPEKGYEDIITMKKEIHKMRMSKELKCVECDYKLSDEMFNEALEDLHKHKKDKYQFLTEGGYDLKVAIGNLFKYIWKNEIKPDKWRIDTLVQIHKKGSKLDLDNFRFIHMKDLIPKCFGYIVTKEVKNRIINNMSK